MKKTFRLFLLLLAVLMPTTASAYDFEVNGIYYNRNGDNAIVTYKEWVGYDFQSDYSGHVVIPAEVTFWGKTYTVTAIGLGAFYGCSELTGITIPNSVTRIGEVAFYGCSGLTDVTIGDSVKTIQYRAFCNCTGLSSITIPNSVTTICNCAFDNTPWYNDQPDGIVYAGLVAYKYKGTMPAGTSINLANGTLGIAEYAFYECSGLIDISIPNSVTNIGLAAFNGCSGLTSLTIPNSVTDIGNHAFSGCSSLSCVDIGNSVTSFGECAFYRCEGLIKVNITDLAAWCNIHFSFDESDHFTSNPLFYAHHLFLNGEEVKDLVIPSSVASISHAAFFKCSGLTSLTIPNSVNEIGYEAFDYCDSLQTVTCLGTVPPVMQSYDIFSTIAYDSAKLLVPRQFIETYQATNYWNKFAHIEGYGSAGPGDVDSDGKISINDVAALIDAILKGNMEGIDFESADLNGNSHLDIDDLTVLIDILLNSN